MARRAVLVIAAGLVGLAFALGGRRKVDDCPDIYEPDEPAVPVDDYAEYVGQSSCDPTEKIGMRLFREYVWTRFGGGGVGIVRPCSAPGTSEHEEGRAWDWGIVEGADLPGGLPPRFPADVDGFIEWLTCTDKGGNENANARRAGVMYMIYDRRIWRAYDKPGEPRGHWYPYSGSDPHTSHIHVSLSWAGANAQSSLYDMIRGGAVAPLPVT
ncbi:hypothetical protein LCGC14_1022880 [marine sediment metagenome]|uniref:ARB-07466-like C-terminal domain-containing protein n=1 Tax=marine sediment metagenome TaxID=412755 RepID=A0A0F9N1H5_9ZZZZ